MALWDDGTGHEVAAALALSLPGGYGTWTLTLPGGQELSVKLGPVPVTGCDHRHQSHGYQPSDTLRHLVEIRDGECTFPPCSRHARNCDFEHAIPQWTTPSGRTYTQGPRQYPA